MVVPYEGVLARGILYYYSKLLSQWGSPRRDYDDVSRLPHGEDTIHE